MKHSRAAVHRKVHKLPALRFEQQTLTSYGGLVLLQALLGRLELKDRLRACFSHLHVAPIFGHNLVVLLLVVHLFLGYREFRDARYYRDDPLLRRLLGLTRLPDVTPRSVARSGKRMPAAWPRSAPSAASSCRTGCTVSSSPGSRWTSMGR